MIAVLHTWGQNISLHPHLHCLVPGGGLSPQGKWKKARSKGKYLYPVKALSKMFRGKFTDGLIKLQKSGKINMQTPFDADQKHLHPLYRRPWVVYAVKPTTGPKHVVEYLGRYVNRVAIANSRIKKADDQKVVFSWKDYRTGKKADMSNNQKQ
ncbi:MAG: transposase [Salinivirgaceae bacterium]|nr:transposase [Salinivirgaceae bacterium]